MTHYYPVTGWYKEGNAHKYFEYEKKGRKKNYGHIISTLPVNDNVTGIGY